jgi:PKD repeat protein
MNTKYIKYYLGLAGAFLCLSAQGAQSPLSLSQPDMLKQAELQKMPPLDNTKLRQRDALERATNTDNVVLKFAEPIKVAITPSDWQSQRHTENGKTSDMSVWSTKIVSSGALSLNFGFSEYFMPEGGSLHIYTPNHAQNIRPFTAKDNDDHGQLWTPMLKGDTVIIEVNVPTKQLKQLKLTLSAVNHGYLGANPKDIYETLSGSCNVDVSCSAGDEWRDQIRSAAAISLGGSGFCSGGALNNTANDGRGFFLTAFHCGINAGNAASLVTYWNFENSVCRAPDSGDSGGPGDGTLDQFNTGAIFRAGHSPSDMTLVELDDPFDPGHNVFLAGWNAADEASTSAVAIHHPSVDEKRISFENDATTITSYSGDASPGDGTHVRVIDWDLGTTEPGSSGSHLFDQNKRVIGQLHGGGAACGNDQSDWYGRIHTSWDGGGTASTRLSTWLDPESTGEMAIDGMNATDPGDNQLPVANINGPYLGFVDTAVDFSSAGSEDADGTIVNFLWGFGDDSDTSELENPSHVYSARGSFEVSLKVTDDDGASRTAYTQAAIFDQGQDELISGESRIDLSAETNAPIYFYMQVPANATNLEFVTVGETGDADLYVKQGSLPTLSDYDCRSFSASSNETCSFPTPDADVWYVMVNAYAAYDGLSLTGTFEADETNTPPVASFDASFNDADGTFTSTSTDADGDIVSWAWDFGDGNTGSGESTTHSYVSSGNYTVSLTVTDDGDAQHTASQSYDVTVPASDIEASIIRTLKSRRGTVMVDLSWGGASGDKVSIYRDDEMIAETNNDGRFRDRFRTNADSPDSVDYKICDASGCSDTMTASY